MELVREQGTTPGAYCEVCGAIYPNDPQVPPHKCAVDPEMLAALLENAAAAVVMIQQIQARIEATRRAIVLQGEKPAPLDASGMIRAVARLERLGFALQAVGPRRLPTREQ